MASGSPSCTARQSSPTRATGERRAGIGGATVVDVAGRIVGGARRIAGRCTGLGPDRTRDLQVSGLTDVTLAGYSGKRLQVQLPATLACSEHYVFAEPQGLYARGPPTAGRSGSST
jgi:hypothetical protein